MAPRLNVAVLFGGRSCEHEVSVMSARGIVGAIDRSKFNPIPLGVTKQGSWRVLDETTLANTGSLSGDIGRPVTLDITAGERRLIALDGAGSGGLPELDAVLPIIHGPLGEDGTVQGLFEIAGIPYVGSGVLGSAVSMDKRVMKVLLQSRGLPVARYLPVAREEWERRPEAVLARCEAAFPFPWFVKPANMGSSVGVSKVGNSNELSGALDVAAQYDQHLLVEEGIAPAREIEVSVLGNEDPTASVPGEIVPSSEFYDYSAKYLDGKSGLVIPADLPESTCEMLRFLAIEAFKALECQGLARVDFLYHEESGEVYVLEANTLPGFTPISMYPKLWEASGLSYTDLISRLLELALQRHVEKTKTLRAIEVPSLG